MGQISTCVWPGLTQWSPPRERANQQNNALIASSSSIIAQLLDFASLSVD